MPKASLPQPLPTVPICIVTSYPGKFLEPLKLCTITRQAHTASQTTKVHHLHLRQSPSAISKSVPYCIIIPDRRAFIYCIHSNGNLYLEPSYIDSDRSYAVECTLSTQLGSKDHHLYMQHACTSFRSFTSQDACTYRVRIELTRDYCNLSIVSRQLH